MARRCSIWTLAVALVLTTGGHWSVLQVFAWAGMLVRYAQEVSVPEAVVKTFDGRHPCALCKAVREGRAKERQREATLAMPKLELCANGPAAVAVIFGEPGEVAHYPPVKVGVQRHDAPPVPPPRWG